MPFVPDEKLWERRPQPNGKILFHCVACRDGRMRESFNCRGHEGTQQHKLALEALKQRENAQSQNSHPSTTSQSSLDKSIIYDSLSTLLSRCATKNNELPKSPYPPYATLHDNDPTTSQVTGFDWNVLREEGEIMAETSPLDDLRTSICQSTFDFLHGDFSDFEPDERPSDTDSNDFSDHDIAAHTFDTMNDMPSKRQRRTKDQGPSDDWFPWQDRITCSLDILMHLPRSVFSRRQLDLFLWLLRVNKVENVPSVKSMTAMNKILQKACGIDTIAYDGKMGHRYHVNNLSQIIAQEIANPLVMRHLYFYPEDSGKCISEARQAARWLYELPDDQLTPMIRANGQDYYVFEPALIANGTFCVPFRWFIRGGHHIGRAWKMEVCVVDGIEGWVIRKDIELEVSEADLRKPFSQLCCDHDKYNMYNVPRPSVIHGVWERGMHHGDTLLRWTHTNPVLGNKWRSIAQGHRTVSLPLWLYCDDTSGNMSKKWNEHNSFLFTFAGLPREQSAKEYNIHFLCTSNIAPPLEMMDGVVSQIEDAQKNGIWAWDCIENTPILIFPIVFALLGDNPMHSEFACHIGLRGKFFCRACWVKGSDALDAAQHINPNNVTPPGSPTGSANSSMDGGSDYGSANSVLHDLPATVVPLSANKKGRYKESMVALLNRIKAFIKPSHPRTKAETQGILASYFEKAKTIGAKTKLKIARTETGIKDTMQEFFLDKMLDSYKDKIGPISKQNALDQALGQLPNDITSPVWRLKEIDPHQDTPVEILHVVLLGFIKYFWRDLIQNQIDDEQRKTLIRRINDFDVRGLGISKLGGETLVKYAGSLTGRDFRAISQITPFVIYDLVPAYVYDAWLALSKLVPLIWQPIIEDIDSFLTTLEHEIHVFLLKTARWTCAWFNKTKFHIFLHLPSHIRRFGPAILFATEGFESFNAVIRGKSIHSNRQAPSRDIALAFAQCNRLRHLLSGGYFQDTLAEEVQPSFLDIPKKYAKSRWVSIGPQVRRLLEFDSIISSYMGITKLDDCSVIDKAGTCKRDTAGQRILPQTMTGQKLGPSLFTNGSESQSSALYETCQYLYLVNGDKCSIHDYVIVQRHSTEGQIIGQPYVGCVREIVQRIGSVNHVNEQADGILVQTVNSSQVAEKFQMPRLILQNEWSFIPPADILCTVNTQHDCHQHACTASGIRYIYQERVKTAHSVPAIEHQLQPEDRILNTAQMRDAVTIQKFRIPAMPLQADQILEESAANAINQRNKGVSANTKQKTVHKAKQTAPAKRGAVNGSPSHSPRTSRALLPGEGIIDFRL